MFNCINFCINFKSKVSYSGANDFTSNLSNLSITFSFLSPTNLNKQRSESFPLSKEESKLKVPDLTPFILDETYSPQTIEYFNKTQFLILYSNKKKISCDFYNEFNFLNAKKIFVPISKIK